MAFSNDELRKIQAILDPWCEQRVPIMIRDKLVLQYRITRHDVVLLEKRPHWRRKGEWTESPVAKFRLNRRTGLWTLFCQDRNLRWRRYAPADSTDKLQTLTRHVELDPTGIFWG